MPSPAALARWLAATAGVLLAITPAAVDASIGINWGMMASNPLPPLAVVEMLQANGIKKVKLFDANSWSMDSLSGSGIDVMVAIPNDQLDAISSDYANAQRWVKENVTAYYRGGGDGGVSIRYVAVGNEPFLKSYNGSFTASTFPALKNVQKALDEAGVGGRIKASVPLNADVYNSPDNKPSSGDFRSDIHGLMVDIVRFLHSTGAPFVVNIYPFLSLYQNADFPQNFAFFEVGGQTVSDGSYQYTNVFDANFDTLVVALKKAGVPDLPIVVGEVGWPTDGDKNANANNAKRFYDGLTRKMAKKAGTPRRPGKDIEVYLFGLVDENMKSILPGNFERHWGLLTYDGKPKFPIDLTGKGDDRYLVSAKVAYLPSQWCVYDAGSSGGGPAALSANIQYACQNSDCTSLDAGGSCSGLDSASKTSYAFNMYFQMQDQDVRACDFQGLAKIDTKNASTGSCNFPVQIVSGARRAAAEAAWLLVAMATAATAIFISV